MNSWNETKQSKCRKINTESQRDHSGNKLWPGSAQMKENVSHRGDDQNAVACQMKEVEIIYLRFVMKEVDLFWKLFKRVASHQYKILFCFVLFLIIPQPGKTNLGDHIFLPSGTIFFWVYFIPFIPRTTRVSHFINRIIIININQTVQVLNLPLFLLDIKFMHGTCWISITLL